VITAGRSPGRVGSLLRVDDGRSSVDHRSIAVSAREISGSEVDAAEHESVRIRADAVENHRAPVRAPFDS
jgi:hypothetical protein